MRTLPLLLLRLAVLAALAAIFLLAAQPRPASTAQPAAAGFCPPLPPPGGAAITVTSVAELQAAVNQAAPGDTILIADGVYALDGVYLRISAPQVTLRSASGQRDHVTLDGNYLSSEIIQIVAPQVTIADLTLREAYNHPIHVMSTETSAVNDTLIYNVRVIDPGQQAIKINPVSGGYFTDNGEIACSLIELTASGRPHIRDNCYTGGIDAHQSSGWVVRDNLVRGFWCASGLSEHAIHFWVGSRDTLVERNQLLDNARGIGFGLVTSGNGRVYPDDPCPQANGYVDHFGGLARNNFIAANDDGLFASEFGFDCGICLWNACAAQALHNTVFSADAAHTFSAIEWRFANTSAEIAGNLVNAALHERDGAAAVQTSNVSGAQASWFAAAGAGDLHLTSSAAPALDQASAHPQASEDFDGQARPSGPAADAGADEYLQAPPGEERVFLPLLLR